MSPESQPSFLKQRTRLTREDAVRHRNVNGAVLIASAEGRGIISPDGDARALAATAARRALMLRGRS